jgi:DeoR family transcriptional regulator, glycerol-3-phosphate regulon repressor
MNATARQSQIVDLVRQEGYVTVEALADRFQVTPQTIRRDISLLQDRALLRRFHGGVTAPGSVENFAYSTRQVLCLEEKRRIARLVARQVPDNASLFLNIGTTTEEVARALLGHRGLRVITNNINVANILYSNASCEVIVAGGVVRARDGGIVGEATLDFVRQFKVDVGIIGISGIDGDGTLLDYDYREVRVARAIIDNSRQVFLVTDHTKFGRNAMVRLASIGEIHALFTDRAPPAPFSEAIAATTCYVHVAD